MTEQNGITRRGVLGRLALLVGGAAAGAGVAVKAVPEPAPPTAPAPQGARQLVLRVGDLRSYVPAVEPGKLPKGRWTSLPTGTLVGDRDEPIGRFHAAALPGAGGSMLQTFELPGGTILGIGGPLRNGGAYAVVGGTGEYTGASGSYVASQSASGTKQSAEFTITLRALEA